MHQSPDGTMYWLAGQEGMLLRVGVGRDHPTMQRSLKKGRILELYGIMSAKYPSY